MFGPVSSVSCYLECLCQMIAWISTVDAKLSHCPCSQGVWRLVAERVAKEKTVVEWCGGYECHRKLSQRKGPGAEIRGDLSEGDGKRKCMHKLWLESDCEGEGLKED